MGNQRTINTDTKQLFSDAFSVVFELFTYFFGTVKMTNLLNFKNVSNNKVLIHLKMKDFLCILLFFPTLIFSQALLEPAEECVFSFKTKNGKTMMLAKEKNNKYLIYRYGTKNKIELEFPFKDSRSWNKFTYNFYFRGGGKQNAGLDIDNLKFENNGYKYIIYAVYSAGDEENEESYNIGILIYNKKNKVIRMEGITETAVGNLYHFRTNNLVKIDLESELEE